MKWKILFESFAIVCLVALAGYFFTYPAVNSDWYSFVKPPLAPPNWVFPVVWSILFFLIALSLYSVWTSKWGINRFIQVYGVNLILNVFWSFLFFTIRNPLVAFYEILLLWISVVVMLNVTWRLDKMAFYLLIPYFVWVSFAVLLNYLII